MQNLSSFRILLGLKKCKQIQIEPKNYSISRCYNKETQSQVLVHFSSVEREPSQ